MITYTFSAEGFDSTDKLQRYTKGKVKDLSKYVPRFARESASLSVHCEIDSRKKMKTCHLALDLPKQTLVAKETAEHVYSAMDIAMADIRHQLSEYKDKHTPKAISKRIARAIRFRKSDTAE